MQRRTKQSVSNSNRLAMCALIFDGVFSCAVREGPVLWYKHLKNVLWVLLRRGRGLGKPTADSEVCIFSLLVEVK